MPLDKDRTLSSALTSIHPDPDSSEAKQAQSDLQSAVEALLKTVRESIPQLYETMRGAKNLGANGWTFPMLLTPYEMSKILAHGESEYDECFLSFYSSMEVPLFKSINQRLAELNEVEDCRVLFAQCEAAYHREDFAIAVGPMISLFERAIRTLSVPQQFHTLKIDKFAKAKSKAANHDDPKKIQTYAWISLAAFVDWLYCGYSPSKQTNRLFRHGIQHGTQLPPNSRIDCLRLFHAFDTALSLNQ